MAENLYYVYYEFHCMEGKGKREHHEQYILIVVIKKADKFLMEDFSYEVVVGEM